MHILYLELYSNGFDFKCSLETLITLCVFDYCNVNDLSIVFVQNEILKEEGVPIDLENVKFYELKEVQDLRWEVKSCKLPVIISGNSVYTGLCGVARELTKFRSPQFGEFEHPEGLLGFRNSSLQAPYGVSVWTKFCEIDILRCVKFLIKCHIKDIKHIPSTVVKFENHLSQPLRLHNIYKVARDSQNQSKQRESNDILKSDGTNVNLSSHESVEISNKRNGKQRKWKNSSSQNECISSKENSDLLSHLQHVFAEGPFLTLADILLYPCYIIIFKVLGQNNVMGVLPRTAFWFKKMEECSQFESIRRNVSKFMNDYVKEFDEGRNYLIPDLENVSLYKCDPKRHNPKKREFTKDEKLKLALNYFIDDKINMLIKVQDNKFVQEKDIPWSEIPPEANPHGNYLPDKRKERKTQQLENIIKCVVKIAKDGQTIVDFCCGCGHLGILLAYLLPNCTVILLENKEESLNRAKMRINNVGLKNIHLFQCNIDYFLGQFDIGVALHACGVATDLVLEKCIRQNASFVVCPCCYGSLNSSQRLQYPRSKKFSTIPLDKYISICHAADQTHIGHPLRDQGILCMNIIDSDRLCNASENGYDIFLTQIQPVSCTPKNMLLVGYPNVDT